MAQLSIRILAILTLIIGAAIGWLTAGILYLRIGSPLPVVALLVMYGFVVWQFRWWAELRYRVPTSIIGGSLLLSMLRPASVSRRILIPNRDLLSLYDGFYAVNWALIGAVFFTFVVLAIAPMNPDDRLVRSQLTKNGG